MAAPQDYGFEYQDVVGMTEDDFQKLMEAEPEKYPEHLRIALSLDRWAEILTEQQASGDANSTDQKHLEELLVALPEIQTVMRQGQFLPGQRFRALTDAELKNAERAADAKLDAAFEEGFNG